jgi:hypothetical protein
VRFENSHPAGTSRMSVNGKTENLLPTKAHPSAQDTSAGRAPFLPGSLHPEWRRCGKPNCRCARGLLHGPYYVRRWRQGGKQRKALVKPEDVAEVLAAIERRRALAPAYRIRTSLRGLDGV